MTAGVSWPEAAITADLREKVASARVLAVGAGGIGCELLKTLAMSGFNHIDVIDLDTIETSNLNRQFLFRKRHVGRSKAEVAADAVRAMRPGITITAHQANVKDPAYGLPFFQQFHLVLSGLDNLEARRHVNRLCLAAGVPLVESGTAGYLGQVAVHVKGVSECFECAPKAAPKTFPVCTIRNTPDKPVHCVVWAKDLLFQRLFGSSEAATDLDDVDGDEGGAAAAAATRDDPSFFARREGEPSGDYAARIFRRVYCTDVEKLVAVESMWRGRRPPTPLHLEDIVHPGANGSCAEEGGKAGEGDAGTRGSGTAGVNGGTSGSAPSACRSLGLLSAHSVWDLRQNARVFLEAVRLFLDERGEEVGALQFDKDDALAVEFVAAAANLRALCYGIPPLTLFDAKGMAGNIIHAIATTNAVVSGLIVVEALKLLAGALPSCRTTFIHQRPTNNRLLTPMAAPPPNPDCLVCGRAQLALAINTHTATLAQLVNKILKGRLSLLEPTLSCGGFMYEEGEGLDEDEVEANAALLPRTLSSLPGGGLHDGSMVEVSDQRQHLTARLIITHQEDFGSLEDNPERYVLLGALPPPKPQQAQQRQQQDGAGGASEGQWRDRKAGAAPRVREDPDGVLLLDDSEEEGATRGGAAAKRKAAEGGAEGGEGSRGQHAKRAKASPAAANLLDDDDDVIELLDDD